MLYDSYAFLGCFWVARHLDLPDIRGRYHTSVVSLISPHTCIPMMYECNFLWIRGRWSHADTGQVLRTALVGIKGSKIRILLTFRIVHLKSSLFRFPPPDCLELTDSVASASSHWARTSHQSLGAEKISLNVYFPVSMAVPHGLGSLERARMSADPVLFPVSCNSS